MNNNRTFKIELNFDELIFLSKVLDQKSFFNRIVNRTEDNKDHLILKRKVLRELQQGGIVYCIEGPIREIIFLQNSITQYFIATLRNDLFEVEKKYLPLLKRIVQISGKDLNQPFNSLID